MPDTIFINILEIFLYLIFLYFITIFMQILHEIGHYIPAYLYGLNPFFRYETCGIPDGVFYNIGARNIKNLLIIISGIILGTLPLIIYTIFLIDTPLIIFIIPLTFLYIWGCGEDISDAFQILKISK